jgi:hypothetical protein
LTLRERSSFHGRLSWRAGRQKRLVNETGGGEAPVVDRLPGLGDLGAVEIPHDNEGNNNSGGY